MVAEEAWVASNMFSYSQKEGGEGRGGG